MIRMNRIVKNMVVIVCCTIVSLLIVSCFSPLSFEQFHKPTVVEVQPQKRVIDANGTLYTYNITYNKIVKYSVNGSKDYFEEKINFFVNQKNIFGLCSNKSYIFIGVHYYVDSKENDSRFGNQIHIYDKNMNKVKIIDIEENVLSMTVNDNSLYCCYSEYDSTNGFYSYGLLKYSFDDFEKTILPNCISVNNYYLDGETTIFLQECNPFSKQKNLCIVNDGFFLTSEKSFACFHPIIGLISFIVDGDKLSINYSNKHFEFNIPFLKSSFYNYVYIQDDFTIFGLKEYLENENCVPNHSDCICHYGQSLLMKYDLKKGCFLETITFDPQTILIDYDFDGAYYYFDGAFYNHGKLIKKCEKIETGETINVVAKEYHKAPAKYLSLVYFKNKFYGL